jgi:hypothetical protein
MQPKTTTMLFATVLALGATGAWARTMTLTGTVGDAMCGVTHMVEGDDAACTLACVKGGAEYALIVKNEAYTLEGDAAIKAKLQKLANQRVTVTGEQHGKSIDVTSVQAAK